MRKPAPKPKRCFICGKKCWGIHCKKCYSKKPSRPNTRLSAKKSTVLRTCKRCGKPFYGVGTQKFDTPECCSAFNSNKQYEAKKMKKRQTLEDLEKEGLLIKLAEGTIKTSSDGRIIITYRKVKP